MKKIMVLVSLLLIEEARAVCFQAPFDVMGEGETRLLAEKDAQRKADEACGADDYNWSTKKTAYTYQQLSCDLVSATAKFQCCMSW